MEKEIPKGKRSKRPNKGLTIEIRLNKDSHNQEPDPQREERIEAMKSYIGSAMRSLSEKISNLWQKLKEKLGNPRPITPFMSYKDWQIGRESYYEVLEMKRPARDYQLDLAKVREHYGQLSNVFVTQGKAHPAGTKVETEADKIWNKIDEAYKTLMNNRERMFYNLRMDYTDRSIPLLAGLRDVLLVAISWKVGVFTTVYRRIRFW